VAELNGDAVPASQLAEQRIALLPAQPQGLLRRDQQLHPAATQHTHIHMYSPRVSNVCPCTYIRQGGAVVLSCLPTFLSYSWPFL